jgi:peptide/nickel transport system substrate-binding protein
LVPLASEWAAGREVNATRADRQRRWVMKKVQVFLSVMVPILLFLGASSALAQTRSEVLVIGQEMGMITSLDPAKGFEVIGSGVMAQVYDRLLDFSAGKFDKPEPSLAESWKVSPDGLVWTFNLRKDVKFHSGNPMTSEDVLYSFQRAVLLKDQPAFILTQFGLTPESFKAPDKYTFQITLPKKYAGGLFLACMAAIVSSAVDSQVVKQNVAKTDQYPNGDYGVTWLSRNSAGSGPFILRKWEKGEGVVLDANPSHFRYPPKIKRIIYKDIAEANSRRLQVEKGDVDIAWNMFPDQVRELEKNKDIRIERYPDNAIEYLGMNVTRPYLSDKRVRMAIRYAIDYDGIINMILGGAAKQTNTFIPEGFAGYEPRIIYKTDIEKAKQLMQEAGASGFETNLYHIDASPRPDVAQVIQASLAKIGIKVTLNKMVGSQLMPLYRAQKTDLFLGGWGPDYNDPHTNATPFADHTTKQLAYRNAYENEQTAKMIQDAGQEMDDAKRIALYQAANKIIQEEGPFVFLYQQLAQHAVRNTIQDLKVGPNPQLTKFYTVTKK